MLNSLKAILDDQSPAQTKIIMDARAYAHKVLMQNKPYPWHDATLYSNYMKQVHSLLQADVLVLRFDKMLEEELKNNHELVAKMGEKQRSGYALKVFMADEGLKEITSSLINTATNTLHISIMTQLPSPLSLLQMTAQAVGKDQDFDDDLIENAGIYYADWLRSYKDSKVTGLLFDERDHTLKPQHYQPITNTASNYDWVVGFRRASVLEFMGYTQPIPILDSAFWLGEKTAPPPAPLFFTEIHQDAMPEKVLEKLHQF
ncbi:hypothetical protein [Helicobacter bizzozeronii]|uniref:hypothetical protein n=1 Tax=Helicobacter bizzozeronii TaxID=56877 RepID=UPI00024E5D76|nr:hypothetical protein [Helicobacter bizzozeronii]GMB92665.1 hypothetical protein NHP200010_03760 [Helicobacter bizzozeronii]CCF81139.1 hypothetical protein HBZS_115900 [Helicobacter bizzozeronii CCUG 35545]